MPGGSRFAVGSSRTSNPGRVASTSAIASRCFSPPESVSVARASKPASPALVSASGTRCRIDASGQPRFSRPKATSSSTRPMTSWLSGSWKTRPTLSPSSRAGVSATSSSPTRSAALPLAGQHVRDQAGQSARERALARPGRAEDEQDPPRLQTEGQTVEGGPGAAGVRPAEARRFDRGRSRPGRWRPIARSVRHAPEGNVCSAPVRRSDRTSSQPPTPTIATAEIISAAPITARPP